MRFTAVSRFQPPASRICRVCSALPSVSTPALAASTCPNAMSVSIKMVGITISLAGMAST